MQALDLIVRAGEAWDYTWSLYDAAGKPLNPSGYTASFVVFENDSSTSAVLSLSLGSGISLTTGLMAVSITSAQGLQLLTDLAKRRSGRYASFITSGGGKPLYVAAGKLDIVKLRP